MKTYLIAYDIADKKRLARVRKVVYSYALGGQKSVLEAPLNKKLLQELIDKLNNIMIRPVNKIHNYATGKTETHILDEKFMLKLRKYLNKYGYKYCWQEVSPDCKGCNYPYNY